MKINKISMTESRICVLTMIGGIDVIGELIGPEPESLSAELRHPTVLRIDPQGQMTMNPVLKSTNILAGESVQLNMAAVMWISEPSPMLLGAYKQQLSPIILPKTAEARLNQ